VQMTCALCQLRSALVLFALLDPFCIIIHRDWKVDESRCLKSVDVCSLLQRRLLWRGDQTSGLLLLVNPHVLSVDVLEPTSVMRSVHDLYHVLFHFLH
jgi:hypothetical protein